MLEDMTIEESLRMIKDAFDNLRWVGPIIKIEETMQDKPEKVYHDNEITDYKPK